MKLEERGTLTCPICGVDGFKNLTGHIRNGHGLEIDEFRKKYSYEGPLISLEQARYMASISNSKWNDPEVRKHRIEGIKKSYDENDLRQLRSDTTKKQWENPEIRKRMIESVVKSKSEWSEERRRAFKEALSLSKCKFKTPMSLLKDALYERENSSCQVCGITEEEHFEKCKRRLSLHHINYDKTIPDLEDVMLLCSSCHRSIHNEKGKNRFNQVANAVGNLLDSLGVDLEDENFIETPRRVATYLLEHFMTEDEVEFALEEYSSAVFPNTYGNMVLATNIDVNGICPHHLLPVIYEVTVAYIPNSQAIGLSKLARIASILGSLPIIQEHYTSMLADTLEEVLGTEDVAALVQGVHMCMKCRGIRVESPVSTSALRGLFMSDKMVRDEYYMLIQIGQED